jgi:hypothetical protein
MSPPAANPYGNGSRVSELLGPATWENLDNQDSTNCASIPPMREVAIDGVTVTAIDRYDETGEIGSQGNIYVQDAMAAYGDPPVPYSGVTVYDPSFSPPDLRLVEGDVVDVFGVLMEFQGPTTSYFSYCRTLPEIGGTMGFRFEAPATVPVAIQASDLASYEGMRRWLGMLVRIDNLTLGDDPYDPPTGRYSIRIDVGGGVQTQDIPTLANEFFDLKTFLEGTGLPLSAGTTFPSVTGVVTYFYGTHISPRSAADIVL